MKTITLTDDQFDTLFEYVDNKVTTIVNASVDYQDSEILEDWAKYEDWSDIFPETYCMCEQCFNAYDRLGKIKWKCESVAPKA